MVGDFHNYVCSQRPLFFVSKICHVYLYLYRYKLKTYPLRCVNAQHKGRMEGTSLLPNNTVEIVGTQEEGLKVGCIEVICFFSTTTWTRRCDVWQESELVISHTM